LLEGWTFPIHETCFRNRRFTVTWAECGGIAVDGRENVYVTEVLKGSLLGLERAVTVAVVEVKVQRYATDVDVTAVGASLSGG